MSNKRIALRREERPHKTNVEFITELMTFARSGPLIQPFVLTAIEKFAEQVIAAKPEDWPENSMVSLEAWQRCAHEAKAAIESHLTN